MVMNETQKYIKKINVSTFKGTVCLSEKEFERHLSIFAYQRSLKFEDFVSQGSVDGSDLEFLWNEFLKEEEHKRTTK